MSTFEYKSVVTTRNQNVVIVRLDGKVVGNILEVGAKYAYQPIGTTTNGDEFSTIAAVKLSIEGN